nr:serine protease inhibitor 286 [Nosema bombycis]
MKICGLVQFAYLYLTSATFSCFKPTINNEDQEEYVSKFDNLEYETSLKFLEITDKTSCFSPISCSNNVLLMCEAKEFGEKTSELGKKKLSNVSKAVDARGEKFMLVNCLYTKEKPIKIARKGEGWRNENYTLSNVGAVFEKYSKWFKEITEGKMDSPLKINHLTRYDRTYLTVALFKDEWAVKFNKACSEKLSFNISSNRCLLNKIFMKQKNEIKYDKIEINETSYHMVALPYATKNGTDYRRYMLYLIPIKIKGKTFDETQFGPQLATVWKNFYFDYSNNNLKKAITKLNKKKINLLIPQINKLQSEFDMIKFINNILKLSNAARIESTMKTFLNVNEEGTEGQAAMVTCSYDSMRDSSFVVANVPHISFIFDMNLEKILFITKYLG